MTYYKSVCLNCGLIGLHKKSAAVHIKYGLALGLKFTCPKCKAVDRTEFTLIGEKEANELQTALTVSKV